MGESTVTIVIPAFIRDETNLRYFREALLSAHAQTYPDCEILVINDGSPLTTELERLLSEQSYPIRYLKKKNGGVASALNLALSEMTGSYFSWLSHDDLYLPSKVESQMQRIQGVSETTILYCDVEHVDSAGQHLFFERTLDMPPGRSRVYFAQYGAHNANAHLVPRRCFDRVGGFDESLRTTQDNQMWFRLSEHFPFQRVPEVLMKYRNHPTQDSRSAIHLQECNDLFIYFLENLSREDIIRLAGVSPAQYYAECACLRRNRGYCRAASDARRRATREFLSRPWNERSSIGLIAGLWFYGTPSAPSNKTAPAMSNQSDLS